MSDLTARLRALSHGSLKGPRNLVTEAADRIDALEHELDALAENADAFINLEPDATLTAEDGTEVAWGGFWMQVDVEVWRRLIVRHDARRPVADLVDGAR